MNCDSSNSLRIFYSIYMFITCLPTRNQGQAFDDVNMRSFDAVCIIKGESFNTNIQLEHTKVKKGWNAFYFIFTCTSLASWIRNHDFCSMKRVGLFLKFECSFQEIWLNLRCFCKIKDRSWKIYLEKDYLKKWVKYPYASETHLK